MKGCALKLVFIQRPGGTRKLPIVLLVLVQSACNL